MLEIGRVTGIEHNHEQKDYAKAGDDVAVRIASSGRNIEYGRHFDHRHILYSKVRCGPWVLRGRALRVERWPTHLMSRGDRAPSLTRARGS